MFGAELSFYLLLVHRGSLLTIVGQSRIIRIIVRQLSFLFKCIGKLNYQDYNPALEQDNITTDCPAMSFVFVCWHSRKWWLPICGGTLKMALLRPEKVYLIGSFCKKRHSIYMSPAQKQLTGRKMDKNPPKKGVFLAPLASWLSLSVSVAQQIRTNSLCP